MRLPLDLVIKIRKAATFDEVKRELDVFVDRKYKKIQKEMEAALQKREKFWAENIKEFSALVLEKTGTDWLHPFYYYFITAL
jgi:hypothetical protein